MGEELPIPSYCEGVSTYINKKEWAAPHAWLPKEEVSARKSAGYTECICSPRDNHATLTSLYVLPLLAVVLNGYTKMLEKPPVLVLCSEW